MKTPISHQHQLSNGLHVLVIPLPHLQSAAMVLAVRSGSRYETIETNGLSHLTEHMLFRGTKTHPSSQSYHEAVESLGANLYAATHPDHALYQMSVPCENIENAIALLAEVITEPLLHNLPAEKAIIREEALEDVDEQGRDIDIDIVSRHQLFGDHPLGFRIAGTPETLEHLTEEHIRQMLASDYVAGNMVVAVAGSVDVPRVLRELESALGKLPVGSTIHSSPFPWDQRLPKEPFLSVEHTASQSEARLAFLTLGESDPRHPALMLLGRILDDGLSTRVYREICQERGLAYFAFADIESYSDCAILDFGASVAHHKAPALFQAWEALIKGIMDGDITQNEVDKAKARTLWDLRRLNDEAEATCAWYAVRSLLGLPHDLNAIAQRIQPISLAEVKEVAQATFDVKRMALSCVGMLDSQSREALLRRMAAW